MGPKSYLGSLLVLCVALLLGAAAPAGESLEGTAEIQSDTLKVEHKQGRATFSGNVRASYKALQIECDEMRVSYDEAGGVTALTAEGNVVVRSKDAVARAGVARLDTKKDLLILEGTPSLTRGPHRLKGSRIEVALTTGQLDVIDARGTFKFEKSTQ